VGGGGENKKKETYGGGVKKVQWFDDGGRVGGLLKHWAVTCDGQRHSWVGVGRTIREENRIKNPGGGRSHKPRGLRRKRFKNKVCDSQGTIQGGGKNEKNIKRRIRKKRTVGVDQLTYGKRWGGKNHSNRS